MLSDEDDTGDVALDLAKSQRDAAREVANRQAVLAEQLRIDVRVATLASNRKDALIDCVKSNMDEISRLDEMLKDLPDDDFRRRARPCINRILCALESAGVGD